MLVQLLKNEVRRDAEGRYCLNDIQVIATSGNLFSGRPLTVQEFLYMDTTEKCKEAILNHGGVPVVEIAQDDVLRTYVHEMLAGEYAKWASICMYVAMTRVIVDRCPADSRGVSEEGIHPDVVKAVADVLLNRPGVLAMKKDLMDEAIHHIRDSLNPDVIYLSVSELSDKTGLSESNVDQILVEEGLQEWNWGWLNRWDPTPKGMKFARRKFNGVGVAVGDGLEWESKTIGKIIKKKYTRGLRSE